MYSNSSIENGTTFLKLFVIGKGFYERKFWQKNFF